MRAARRMTALASLKPYACAEAKNVGTILWRFQDQLLNVAGRGYWPKDVPNPEPGNHPQQGNINSLDQVLDSSL